MTRLNCAIYTRKSSEEGLEKEFNSLDALSISANSRCSAGRCIVPPDKPPSS